MGNSCGVDSKVHHRSDQPPSLPSQSFAHIACAFSSTTPGLSNLFQHLVQGTGCDQAVEHAGLRVTFRLFIIGMNTNYVYSCCTGFTHCSDPWHVHPGAAQKPLRVPVGNRKGQLWLTHTQSLFHGRLLGRPVGLWATAIVKFLSLTTGN